MKPPLLLSLFLLSFSWLRAQDKNTIKFGAVKPEDLSKKVYPIDSSAGAVIIADIGNCSLEGNTKGWFSVVMKHYRRVHILNKNSYDIANVEIGLYDNGGIEQKLDKLRAVTYNLVDGKVEESKLDTKAGVFEDKLSKYYKRKKFTLPNVKEGSIIEYEYTTTVDYIQYISPWEFQGKYPCLWSEYSFYVPNFFKYNYISQGYLSYFIKDSKESSMSFSITDPNGAEASGHISFTAYATENRWVVKDVPALKEENFTSTIDNHIQKIQFQLVQQEENDVLRYHRYVSSWPEETKKLLDYEDFGAQLDKDNGWLSDLTEPLKQNTKDPQLLARKIYNYIRDNFTCTTHENDIFTTAGLKNVLKIHKGNVADINLLLTAALRHVNIHADPVILSTRSNGYMYAVYPILTQYNYVVCKTDIDDKTYYLDATDPHLGFGKLPLQCYNGDARVVNLKAFVAPLYSDSVREVKTSTIFLINDEKGNIVGSMQQTPGYYESDEIRDRIREKGQDQFIKDIKKAFISQIEISNFGIDSLSQYDNPIAIHYDFDIKDEKEDIIYFNPLFGEAYKENPFKSAERKYPVEMPYTEDETINLQMEVPNGYTVDELPKPIKVKFNEQGDGIFEYQVSQSGTNISLRNRIQLKRTVFSPEEYEDLRDFFDMIVKKQAEQIVFKKKK